MEGFYFDHALLISCIDGLGRFNERLGVYEKDLDTVSAFLNSSTTPINGSWTLR